MPGTDSRGAGNGRADGLTMTVESTASKVVQEEERPVEDEGVRVEPVRKPRTNAVPQVQPEPAITPTHYDMAAKSEGPTMRAPGREVTPPTPGALPEPKWDWYTAVLGMFDWTTRSKEYLENRSVMCLEGNDYCTRGTSETDQAQTLRLFRGHTESQRRLDQTTIVQGVLVGQTYEVELETEVPVEVARFVTDKVRQEVYRLVDMVCSTVKELLKTDPKLWPNSPTYKADLLDEMISTVMDQQTRFGQSEGLTKSLMRDLMQDVMQIAEHDKDHWLNPTYTSCFAETQREINGGPVKEVMTNLLVMTEVDKTQALRSMDETDRRVITMIADAAKTGMLQKLSEHGAWIIKGKYTDCQFTQGKLLDTGVSNEQLDLELEKVQEASFETTAGQYEILAPDYGKASKGGSILTDSEEDSSDSESEADEDSTSQQDV